MKKILFLIALSPSLSWAGLSSGTTAAVLLSTGAAPVVRSSTTPVILSTRTQPPNAPAIKISTHAAAVSPVAAPVNESNPLLKEADAAYAERADATRARMALELYQNVAQQHPELTEAYWKAARAAWWVGDQSDEKREKSNLFNLGISMSQEALKQNPNSVEAHFWLAGNYGSFGETKGILKSLFLLKPIRKELDEVVRLDPLYEGGAGTRVLGVVDYKVPGFAGGDRKRAEVRLRQSYGIDPKNPANVYYLGEYYWTIGNKTKARTLLADLETLEVIPDLIPEHISMKRKAAALLAK